MGIAQRYKMVKKEVADQCAAAGRAGDEVCLLAVSKTVGVEGARQAIEAGVQDLGENRPDQLLEKFAAFPDVRWHFIGNVQSRRIADIVKCATLIHSLYQEKHLRKVDTEAAKLGKIQDVLIEVNVSGEESKSGLRPDEASTLLTVSQALEHVRVRGLMTMAPQGDVHVAQECFRNLRCLANRLREQLPEQQAGMFDQLSMGMSEDWREAIDEGSTIVRIGRAIFSDTFDEEAHA